MGTLDQLKALLQIALSILAARLAVCLFHQRRPHICDRKVGMTPEFWKMELPAGTGKPTNPRTWRAWQTQAGNL